MMTNLKLQKLTSIFFSIFGYTLAASYFSKNETFLAIFLLILGLLHTHKFLHLQFPNLIKGLPFY